MASYGADWQVRLGRYWCGMDGRGAAGRGRFGAVRTGVEWHGRHGTVGIVSDRIGSAGKAWRGLVRNGR